MSSLKLEREFAAAIGAEHAVPLDFPVEWDAGAPMPHFLRNDNMALLTFIVGETDPEANPSAIEKRTSADANAMPLALIEFIHCRSAKLGSPNDEVFHGHPLWGRGLEFYSAQKVVNSRWSAEVEAINKVHNRYDPAHWRELNHYLFGFHDTTFECLADSFIVQVYRESMTAMLARMCRRLLS